MKIILPGLVELVNELQTMVEHAALREEENPQKQLEQSIKGYANKINEAAMELCLASPQEGKCEGCRWAMEDSFCVRDRVRLAAIAICREITAVRNRQGEGDENDKTV